MYLTSIFTNDSGFILPVLNEVLAHENINEVLFIANKWKIFAKKLEFPDSSIVI